jgi:hypothetical protein
VRGIINTNWGESASYHREKRFTAESAKNAEKRSPTTEHTETTEKKRFTAESVKNAEKRSPSTEHMETKEKKRFTAESAKNAEKS